MSNEAPFDPARVRAHRARAATAFEDVLVTRAAQDLAARLAAVNRQFDLSLAIGGAKQFVAAVANESGLEERVGEIVALDTDERLFAPLQGVVGDAEHLPFAEARFGLIVSILTLHWANDLPGALIQIRRALKPDGLFLGSFFGGRTLQELREALLIAESDITGGASPRVAPFADTFDGAQLLQRAGLALPVADIDTVTLRYQHPLRLIADLRAMGETSALTSGAKPMTRALLARMIEIYQQRFADPDGRVRATFEILTLTGWAPHESQQQPLKPGSARTRLADALGVKEISAGETAPDTTRKS